MVYVIFAPKSIEHYFIKSVKAGEDQGLVEEVLGRPWNFLRPRQLPWVRVLLCEDGKPGEQSSLESVKEGFEASYEHWKTPMVVDMVSFSFLDPRQDEMEDLLMGAEYFYFAGIQKPPRGLDDAMRNGRLLHLLRERVQCNLMAFYGVCGGAKVAGQGGYCGLPALDLLSGIRVQYDSSMSAKDATVATNAERQIVQMTSGCALAFVKDQTQCRAVSFTCTKK